MNIREDPEILKVLAVEDLETAGIDHYDFPEIPIWALASAVELAYQKGYAKGIEDHLRNGQ